MHCEGSLTECHRHKVFLSGHWHRPKKEVKCAALAVNILGGVAAVHKLLQNS